mgnify:CR=1 FL=1
MQIGFQYYIIKLLIVSYQIQNFNIMIAEKIITIVSDYYQIPVMVMEQKDRHEEIVTARQVAMFFCKKFTKLSLSKIGSQIGNKDHATVLHAIKTVNNRSDTENNYRQDIERLQELILIELPMLINVPEEMFMENDYYQN